MNEEQIKQTRCFLQNMSNEDILNLTLQSKNKLFDLWRNYVCYCEKDDSYFIDIEEDYIKERLSFLIFEKDLFKEVLNGGQ